MKIVVIGGGAAGMMFLTQYKRRNPEDEVVVYEKTEYVSWAGCPTPYYIADELDFSHVVLGSVESFVKRGINVKINKEVSSVNTKEKYIIVDNEKVYYDKLVIAVGAKSKGNNGFTLSHAVDAVKIKKYIKEHNPKKAVIIGSGFIGLEMAESFISQNIQVDMVEMQDKILANIPENLKEELYKKIEQTGLKLHLGTKVEKYLDNKVLLSNNETLDYDILLTSIGITPNIDFLNNELETLDKKILVDEKFRTSVEDVYAIGDCVYNKYKGENMYIYSPFGDVANKHGIILARNLSKLETSWNGTMGSYASSYFDVKFAGTGLSLEKAIELGYDAKAIEMVAQTKNSGFKDFKPIKIQVVYDKTKKIVLGGVGVGFDSVAQFIDQISIVAYNKMPIEEFINIDFCYSPTNSSVWNPLLVIYRKVIK